MHIFMHVHRMRASGKLHFHYNKSLEQTAGRFLIKTRRRFQVIRRAELSGRRENLCRGGNLKTKSHQTRQVTQMPKSRTRKSEPQSS